MKNFLVIEVSASGDYEIVLGIEIGPHLPNGGILIWTEGVRASFPDRASARAAIDRTDHYRLAFGKDLPQKKNCKIIPIQQIL